MPLSTRAYSVLTHEALIDAEWDKVILPLLKHQYPSASDSDLQQAHAFAYGGAVVPDMGYYPSGSKLFTALLHYQRTGDFVKNILSLAGNVKEYAFALGILSHYNADNYGHSIGINTAVPLIYPRERERFGDTVTWADDHISHVRTEFSFDVLQTARGVYASAAYQGFIGFKIADTLLEAAFYNTYALHLNELFKNLNRTIAVFRWTVTNLLPFITRTAWSTKKQQITDSMPAAKARSFIYRMKLKNYNKQFDKRERPGVVAYAVAFIIRIVPKIGPLRVLKFRQPNAAAEKKFVLSFDTASFYFVRAMKKLSLVKGSIADINIDTGSESIAGSYPPADVAFQQWVIRIFNKGPGSIDGTILKSIRSYYETGFTVTGSKKERRKFVKAITSLKL